MHRARTFFYVAAGIFLLALSYHLGARTATAQAPGNPVVGAWQASIAGAGASNAVVTANGDVYVSGTCISWDLRGNVFGSGPTPALHESWGQLKARYAPSRGTAQPGTQDR